MFSAIFKSIKLKIILMLLLSAFIISMLFSLYSYTMQKGIILSKLEETADRKIKRLSQILVVPLWEVDEKWLETIAQTEMLDNQLYAIFIQGEGHLYVGMKHNTQNKTVTVKSITDIDKSLIQRSKNITHDGIIIGSVNIRIHSRTLDALLATEILKTFEYMLLLTFFLSIVLFVILNYFILNPLGKILHVINKAAHNDYSQDVVLKQNDEIGQLALGFNNMIHSVQEKENMMIAQSRHAAMGEMISMIAHQWRQPITVVAMAANSQIVDVQLNKLDPEKTQKQANSILKQTKHLSQTIDDFKNFFRPNKKEEIVKVNDIIEENLAVVGKSLENSNINIVKEYNSDKEISLHSRELLQVFINIFKNAKEALVEHHVGNSEILVQTYEDDENVTIEICNNGSHISDDIIEKIFDPYFSTKGDKNGTGLGLYMCKTIVEKHLHGTLNAINQKEGGVCFKITLPIGDK